MYSSSRLFRVVSCVHVLCGCRSRAGSACVSSPLCCCDASPRVSFTSVCLYEPMNTPQPGFLGVSGQRHTPLPRTPLPPHTGVQEQPAARTQLEHSDYNIQWLSAVRPPLRNDQITRLGH
eukprot:2146240-Prymnesium_polylepis.1